MDVFIGLDIGTTNIKAIAFSAGGGVIAQSSIRTPVAHDIEFGECHIADELWQGAISVIRNCISQVNIRNSKVNFVSIGVASFAEEGVLLDSDMVPISPIIPWYDRRTEPQLKTFIESIGKKDMRELTGMPLDGSFSLFKILWAKENLSQQFSKAIYFLPIADFINYKLTGQLFISSSLASRTYMFNPYQNKWIDGILQECGIFQLQLPPIQAGGTKIGKVLPHVAHYTGLSHETVVGIGGHDDACAALGAGIIELDKGLLSSGTAEALYALTSSKDLKPTSPSICIGRDATGTQLYVSDFIPTGALIKWVIENLVSDQGDSFNSLKSTVTKAIARLSIQPSNVKFNIIRNPVTLSSFSWEGISLDNGSIDFLEGVLHTTNNIIREIYDEINTLTLGKLKTMFACGGLSNIPDYVRWRETGIGRPIEVHPFAELTAGGAAVLAAKAVDYFDSYRDTVSNLIPQEEI